MESLNKLSTVVFKILGDAGIPAVIIGGSALAHYGYVRNTMDIDVVVGGDHETAIQTLLDAGFERDSRVWFKLYTPQAPGRSVDIVPAGKHMSGNTIPNPTPTKVSTTPEIVDLRTLVAMKVGVIVTNGVSPQAEYKNRADVLELITANHLDRNFLRGIASEVVIYEYQCMWDRLNPGNQDQGRFYASWKEQPDPFSDFLS